MATKTNSRDVLSLLKEDHQKVRDLLTRLSETTPRAQKKRQELLHEIGMELEKHARAEEQIVYPAYLEIAEKDDRQHFFEAAEEHALVRRVLEELQGTPPESEEFGARAKVLLDLVEHHAKEEEKQIFPAMRSEIERERLVEMAGEVENRKAELEPELEEMFQQIAP
jgi:hemerythrin-like domain-containing protein